MPRILQEPRMSARERKLSMLQQMQQGEIQQQQADLASEAAMMSQIAQMYSLDQQQQQAPLQMERLQNANAADMYQLEQARQMDPVRLAALNADVRSREYQNNIAPATFQMAQDASVSNLESAALNRELAQSNEGRAAAMHAPALDAANANAEAAMFNTSRMPDLYDLNMRTGESALQSQDLNRVLASAAESRAAGLFPIQQQGAMLGNESMQGQIDAQGISNRFAPALAQMQLDHGLTMNRIAGVTADWADTNFQQDYTAKNAAITNTTANTVEKLNPGAPIDATTQAAIHNGTPLGPFIAEQASARAARLAAARAAAGLDENGNPVSIPKNQNARPPARTSFQKLRGLFSSNPTNN